MVHGLLNNTIRYTVLYCSCALNSDSLSLCTLQSQLGVQLFCFSHSIPQDEDTMDRGKPASATNKKLTEEFNKLSIPEANETGNPPEEQKTKTVCVSPKY